MKPSLKAITTTFLTATTLTLSCVSQAQAGWQLEVTTTGEINGKKHTTSEIMGLDGQSSFFYSPFENERKAICTRTEVDGKPNIKCWMN